MDNNKFVEAKKYIEEIQKTIDIENPARLEIFSRDQLEVIYEGMLCNINCIDFFIKHNTFDAFQMEEILDGMHRGIDYTVYAKENVDWKKMFILKNLLINGFTSEGIESAGLLNEELDWFEMSIMVRNPELLAV